MKKKIIFPYKVYKKEAYPIIDLLMEGPSGLLETEAYVDSGASVSMFQTAIAHDLGIKITKGKPLHTRIGDGSHITVYLHKIPVQIGNVAFRATIGFSSQLGARFNLIGQKDVFDRFIISFNRKKRKITFQPHK